MPKMTKAEKLDRYENSVEQLREILTTPDDTGVIRRITGEVVNVSNQGQTRVIRFYVPTLPRECPFTGETFQSTRELSWYVAHALCWRYSEAHRGVIVTGCGMDMVFHTAECVVRVLGLYDEWKASECRKFFYR